MEFKGKPTFIKQNKRVEPKQDPQSKISQQSFRDQPQQQSWRSQLNNKEEQETPLNFRSDFKEKQIQQKEEDFGFPKRSQIFRQPQEDPGKIGNLLNESVSEPQFRGQKGQPSFQYLPQRKSNPPGSQQMNNQRQEQQKQNNKRRNEIQQKDQYIGNKNISNRNDNFTSELSFSYKRLQTLSDLQYEDILIQLSAYPKLAQSITETQFSHGIYSYFIQILHKIIMNDEESEVKNSILISFMESFFFQTLGSKFLLEMLSLTRNSEDFKNRLTDLQLLVDIFQQFMKVFRTKINIIPLPNFDQSIKCDLEILRSKYDPFKYEQQACEQLKIQSESLLKLKIDILLDIDRQQVQNEEEKKQSRINQQKNYLQQSYKLLPPDDYLKISVIPTQQDLLEINPFLRAMPEQGDFKDTHDYLDCVFRLLREDAIRPLRDGLLIFRNNKDLDDKELRKSIKDSGVVLFDNAFLNDLSLLHFHGTPIITVRISDRSANANWMSTKKLLPGSLLVLSPDNFNSMFIAIVRERDGKQMTYTARKFKYVDIQIEIMITDCVQQNLDIDGKEVLQNPAVQIFQEYSGKKLKIIESTAYFESYYHVLKKLKEMGTWKKLPFQDYLIGSQDYEILEPLYFEEMIENYPQIKYKIAEGIKQANLDQSQVKALTQCLTKELSLIQGPPGTGKTYIGEHFTKILLNNLEQWKSKGPILIVCYTNHALDQFLNLVKKYTQNFIRIGGRCKDQELQNNSLSEYCQQNGFKMTKGFFNAKRRMEDQKEYFEKEKAKMIIMNWGLMNSLIDSKQMGQVLFSIKAQFSSYFKKILKNYSHHNEEIIKEVSRYIQKLVKKCPDLIVVFWLQIIDLNKLIEYLYQKLNQDPKYFADQNEEDLDQNLDDLDERLLEHQESDIYYFDSSYQQIKTLQDITSQLYEISLHEKWYLGCQSAEDCINYGLSLKPMNLEFQSNIIFEMHIAQRWSLNNFLRCEIDHNSNEGIAVALKNYELNFKQKKELGNLAQSKAILNADIVAMTTTGCAKNAELLKNINFPIIIVEEAAEVFEAHIITVLSKNTEHLILIGDHQQLKPNPAVYELDVKYKLSMSLFERLIKKKFEYVTLSNQRRMRPEISSIIRLIYPQLKDDMQVQNYPSVNGVEQNLFFFDHDHEEEVNKGLLSKYNSFEAQMIVKFTSYLIQQCYRPQQITILSLYQAQSLHIKRLINENFEKMPISNVKVITVDNFQGEENDIIILSLVRSNAQNNIGYLKISNRVNVALSRAKHGMFIFGNANCLYNAKMNQEDEMKELWKNVLKYLQENEQIGKKLKLCCRNHKKITEIQTIKDFESVPEGGCKLKCDARIKCGHTCESFCHNWEQSLQDPDGHQSYICLKTCEREKICKHSCTYKCYQCVRQCLPCLEIVEKEIIKCGHIITVQCNKYNTAKCTITCEKIRICGHQCNQFCSDDCEAKRCTEKVDVIIPECGHQVEKDCFQTIEEFQVKGKCYKNCGYILKCGHLCPNKCGECTLNFFHGQCKQKCQQKLNCGHICTKTCSKDCQGCQTLCDTQCKHSKCKNYCKDKCAQCIQPCQAECSHQKCRKKCFEPCNKKLCYVKCTKLSPFCKKHPCIGLCGDICPKKCKICEPNDEIFQQGIQNNNDASFVQLVECNHCFEVNTIDYWMNQPYDQDIIQFKRCPKCNVIIKKTQRYRSLINQVLIDLNKAKDLQEKNQTENIKLYDVFIEIYSHLKNKQLVGANQTKYQNILKEWYQDHLKTIGNYYLTLNSFKKFKLIRCISSFYGYIMKVDYRMIDKNEIIYQKVKNASNYLITHKFQINDEDIQKAEKLAELIDQDFNANLFRMKKIPNFEALNETFYKCQCSYIYALEDKVHKCIEKIPEDYSDEEDNQFDGQQFQGITLNEYYDSELINYSFD